MENEQYEVEIEKQDYFGNGIVRINDCVVFVEKAVKGDIVLIEITKHKKKFALAKIIKIIKKSEDRVGNICKYSNECGGCSLIHIAYDKQLEYKCDKLKELLTREFGDNIIFDKIESNYSCIEYRNKITLHFEKEELGLYEEKSNKLVPIDKCTLVEPSINNAIKEMKKLIKKEENAITNAVVKTSSNGELLISLTGKIKKEEWIDKFPNDSIYLNDELLHGKGKITEELCGYKFEISNKSFFQINKDMAEVLYKIVLDKTKKLSVKTALDLYCGTGTLTLILGKYLENVVGIEKEKDAVINANENKKLNNIENVSFIEGLVEEHLHEFESNVDLVVVDPPRGGMAKKATEHIKRISPKHIIYVSCNPITLVRDLKLLDEYELKEVSPIDMFPNTYHVETVVLMSKKEQIESK